MSKLCITATACLIAILAATQRASAATLYAGPAGKADAPGTAEQPLGLRDAFAKAAADTAITEIILLGGEYPGHYDISAPKGMAPADLAKLPTLTIRAAEGQVPVIRHAVRINKAQPVEGKPGLFTAKVIPPSDPYMWERDTRIRYITLSNKDSVAAHPASCFKDEEANTLYFSTSDGKAPETHQVWISMTSKNNRAFAVSRHNLVIDGLHFADYVNINAIAIQSYSNNLTIRNCHIENCEKGWTPNTNSTGGVMENCTGVDVAQPMISFAIDVTVRNCRFEKKRDRFIIPQYPQNDCAYQVYSPGKGGTFEGNIARGYTHGVFFKASGGPYYVRHNTFVDVENAMYWVNSSKGSEALGNLVVNALRGMVTPDWPDTFKMDDNLYWNAPDSAAARSVYSPVATGDNKGFESLIKTARETGHGTRDVVGDPRFVNLEEGDYRVLANGAAFKDAAGVSAGAMPVVPTEAAAKTNPMLTLAFAEDTQPLGATGETYRGKSKTGDVFETQDVPRRICAITSGGGGAAAKIALNASDVIGKIAKTRVSIAGGAPAESDFQPALTMILPEKDGEYPVRVQVQNDRGLWSKTAEVVLCRYSAAPTFVGQPELTANDYGVIVAFRSNGPCLAQVEYGPTNAYGKIIDMPRLIKRDYDGNSGKDIWESWTIPAREFAFAVIDPDLAKGKEVHLRVTLNNQLGLSSQSKDIAVKVEGDVRTLHVSPIGEDAPGRGKSDAAYRTLQYAVDRALPGDIVLLAPGTYTGYTHLKHGGVADERLTIAPQQPGTVTIDTALRENAGIYLENAPYVTVRDLRILYYKVAGVYAFASSNLRVEGCTFYNGPGWVNGRGVFCRDSSDAMIVRNLAVGAEFGFFFFTAPRATFLNNTCSQHMYAAACFINGNDGDVLKNNSFCFSGNDIVSIDTGKIETYTSDYNNLGTNVSDYNAALAASDPGLLARIKAQEFKTTYPVVFAVGSKAITGTRRVTGMPDKRFFVFKEWQETSKQDQHSIFADPQYVKPYGPIDRWDWHVKPGSANLGAGENGADIGAFGVTKNP